MIICPVKISKNDNLPKVICDECLEIVLSAYKLKAVSSKSEQYLRSGSDYCAPEFISPSSNIKNNERSPEPEEPIHFVKYESDDSDNNCNFSTPDNQAGRFSVKCDSASRRSLIWNYVGALYDETGNVVCDDYLYCSLCIANGKIKRYIKNNSTSTVLQHLSAAHDIGKGKIRNNFEKPAEKPSLRTVSCDLCNETFANKFTVLRHLHRKHFKESRDIQRVERCSATLPKSNIGRKERVVCDRASTSSKVSVVWNYFGRLVDVDGNEIPEGRDYNYCSLCSRSGVVSRFIASGSTTCLINHLKRKHGLLEESEDSEAEKLKLIKEESEANVKWNSDGYGVECHKSSSRSAAFHYFGKLVNVNGKLCKSNQNFYYCKLCVSYGNIAKRFKKACSTGYLLKHLKKHGVDLTANDITNPLKPIHESSKYCQQCDEPFQTRKAYFNHMRLVHKEIGSADFICHVCSKSFTKNYILLKHMRIHDGQQHSCHLCPAKFSYPEGLKRHIKVHDPAHMTRFQCDKCSNSYSAMKSL